MERAETNEDYAKQAPPLPAAPPTSRLHQHLTTGKGQSRGGAHLAVHHIRRADGAICAQLSSAAVDEGPVGKDHLIAVPWGHTCTKASHQTRRHSNQALDHELGKPQLLGSSCGQMKGSRCKMQGAAGAVAACSLVTSCTYVRCERCMYAELAPHFHSPPGTGWMYEPIGQHCCTARQKATMRSLLPSSTAASGGKTRHSTRLIAHIVCIPLQPTPT